jgi:hypothetical protein
VFVCVQANSIKHDSYILSVALKLDALACCALLLKSYY